MTNEIWSKKIQSALTLDLSREVRFRDDRKDLFIDVLGLRSGTTIVDIGCGPGALTRKIATWLDDNTNIIGVDRDSNFIKYAKNKVDKLDINNIKYIEGDALSLPLDDDSVDTCISHTVIEHVPNKEFLLEQKRVCKDNGIVSVMYCRPDKYINSEPSEEPKSAEREIKLWDKLYKNTEDFDKKYKVGDYWPKEYELPKLFDELGYIDVKVDAFALPVSIDDARNSIKEKIRLIEVEKEQVLEVVKMNLDLNPNCISNKEVEELKGLIERRFSERVELVKNNKSIWDYKIILVQVVSGKVKK